jgi:beta-lactamase superfamily II metal-dependent hydrolase
MVQKTKTNKNKHTTQNVLDSTMRKQTQEEFGDTKGAIRIRITDNTMAKRKKYERINNDLQNIHIKLKIE